jgi:antitoxin YefM
MRPKAEVTESLTARHAAELDGVRARTEGEVARAQAHAAGAAELAETRSAELSRLVAQVEDLRAELARTRDEAHGAGTQSRPAPPGGAPRAGGDEPVPLGIFRGVPEDRILSYYGGMQTLPLSKVRDKLSELVDAASVTREQVMITKNGTPAAVLIGADEWESIQETLFWLSEPGIRETLAKADGDIAAGRTYGEDEVRAEFGVPKRGQ